MKRALKATILATAFMLFATHTAFAKGDIARGKDLTYTCGGCHGIAEYKNAYPNYHVPKIAGQNYEYLVNALKGYRANERAHPTMRAQAKSFSLAEIEDIAAYLESLKPASK